MFKCRINFKQIWNSFRIHLGEDCVNVRLWKVSSIEEMGTYPVKVRIYIYSLLSSFPIFYFLYFLWMRILHKYFYTLCPICCITYQLFTDVPFCIRWFCELSHPAYPILFHGQHYLPPQFCLELMGDPIVFNLLSVRWQFVFNSKLLDCSCPNLLQLFSDYNFLFREMQYCAYQLIHY